MRVAIRRTLSLAAGLAVGAAGADVTVDRDAALRHAAFALGYAAGAPAAPVAAILLDVNGDGRPDLVVANTGGDNVTVLLNTTATGADATSFAAAREFATLARPDAVTAADLDGDGRPDLVVGRTGDGGVMLLLNTTAPGADTADFAVADGLADDAAARSHNTDRTPDPFAFTDVEQALLNSPQVSDSVVLEGFRSDAPIGVTGGEYSLGCTGAFTTAAGTVAPHSTVCVRHTSSALHATATDTTLTVGGVADTFTSTTPAAQDFSQAGALALLDLLLGGLAALGLARRQAKKIRSRGCPCERIR